MAGVGQGVFRILVFDGGDFDGGGGAEEISEAGMTTEDAVNHLSEALKSDPGYWQAWKANIAMAFKDEWDRQTDTCIDLHKVANNAAENFLKQLTRKS